MGTYRIGSWRELVSLSSFEFEIAPATAALVCVDLQRKTLDRKADRGFARSLEEIKPGASAPYFDRVENVIVPNVQALQAGFRDRGAHVVHFIVGPAHRDGRDLPYAFRQTQRGAMESEDGLVALGDPGTGAELVLRNMGIDTLVLVGGHTHACVESTGRAAADLGFKVAIVEDAVINYLPVMHDAAMINFASFLGRVVETQDVLAELDRNAGPPAT
jgi:nicotinamidase-related amidase